MLERKWSLKIDVHLTWFGLFWRWLGSERRTMALGERKRKYWEIGETASLDVVWWQIVCPRNDICMLRIWDYDLSSHICHCLTTRSHYWLRDDICWRVISWSSIPSTSLIDFSLDLWWKYLRLAIVRKINNQLLIFFSFQCLACKLVAAKGLHNITIH